MSVVGLSAKRIGLVEAWPLPGSSEMYRSFDTIRFLGLRMTRVEGGIKLELGPNVSEIPLGNVIGIDYEPKPANDNAKSANDNAAKVK
jgi:hypothetical protein